MVIKPIQYDDGWYSVLAKTNDGSRTDYIMYFYKEQVNVEKLN